jgi:hypothetical protein
VEPTDPLNLKDELQLNRKEIKQLKNLLYLLSGANCQDTITFEVDFYNKEIKCKGITYYWE